MIDPRVAVARPRRTFRDDSRETEFRREGFVAEAMLVASELSTLVAGFGRLRPDDGFAPDQGRWRAVTYHCSFLDTNREYRRRTFDLVAGIFQPHVDRLLDNFTILQCNFYVKPPGRGRFGLHQNWPALANLDDVSVTIWCPLVDLSPEKGPIVLVPGSHKILPHVQGPSTLPYFADYEDVLLRDFATTLVLKAGEAVIFDDGLIHGSPPNLTADARPAVQLICTPADATPAYYRDNGDGLFELIHANAEFWLTHDVKDLLGRPPHWQSLGFVRSRNRKVELAELNALLARDTEPRSASLALEAVDPSGQQASPGSDAGRKRSGLRSMIRRWAGQE